MKRIGSQEYIQDEKCISKVLSKPCRGAKLEGFMTGR